MSQTHTILKRLISWATVVGGETLNKQYLKIILYGYIEILKCETNVSVSAS